MKHLTRNHAIRPPMLLVLVVFAMCFVFPNSADAKKFVTIGANATEGDPGDGLEYSSGGSGDYFLGGSTFSFATRWVLVLTIPPIYPTATDQTEFYFPDREYIETAASYFSWPCPTEEKIFPPQGGK